MDELMRKIERLSELAAQRSDPRPLDVKSVMAGIRGLEMEDESLAIPFGFLTGGVAAAAAAAVVVSLFGAMAWTELTNPYPAVASLMDVMDAIL